MKALSNSDFQQWQALHLPAMHHIVRVLHVHGSVGWRFHVAILKFGCQPCSMKYFEHFMEPEGSLP
jgi:hypothetical protein